MSHSEYVSPFSRRYASVTMQELFSEQKKFSTWRRLWLALAETERELGLQIRQEQIDELSAHLDDINFERAAELERELRHDVMAHVHAYAEQCPAAASIIHLGATSCYVGDNCDLILMREGLGLLRHKLLKVLANLADFAMQHRNLPCLGFTHFQAAQPVTVGKRASLWINDLLMDLNDLNYISDQLAFLGSKGTTGTQASFLELFDGDNEKCRELDRRVARRMGFDKVVPVSGQTYSRKTDSRVVNVLAGIAQSAHKFSNDIRLLQHLKEIEEPFEKSQIGSSAMPYKRNPMRAERMGSLARYLISLQQNPAQTAAEQWLERSLDDSANKRIAVAEAFLCCDGILTLYDNISSSLVVYPNRIRKHLQEELPFMASENLLMEAVKAGANRQELHEKIRRYSMEAGREVKEFGRPNNLLELLANDPEFPVDEEGIRKLLDPALYIGRSSQQVEEFIHECVDPILERYRNEIPSETAKLSL